MYQSATFSHAQKLGNFDLIMGGQIYNDDGYRDSANEQRVRANLNLRYRFKKIPGLMAGINSTIMSYTGRLFFLWKNADSAFMSRPGALSVYSNQRNNVDPYITYTSKLGGKHSLRGRYFLTNNTNSSGGLDQSSRAELYYGEYQWQKRFKNNLNINAGGVAMRQVVLAPYLYGNHFGKNLASYIQLDKKFFNRLTLSGGMRMEYYKVDTAETHGGFFLINAPKKTNLPVQPVFRAGLNYQVFEYTFIRASFGQGYRFPSDAEKYINTLVGGLNVYPNSSLQPEKGFTSEVGIKQGFKIGNFQGFADAAYFVSHYYNYIDFVFSYGNNPIPPNTPIVLLAKYAGFQFQNIGNANINGVDISVSGTGKIGNVRVDLLSGYTYCNPINPDYNPKTDTNGTSKSNLLRYRNKTMVKNDVQLTYKNFSFGWSIRYTSPMQNIDRRFVESVFYDKANITYTYDTRNFFLLPGLAQYRAEHPNGTWVNDFRIGYQVSKNLKVSFLINNFFNVEFMSRPGLIEAPRTFVFQAAFRF
jgi:iron complex outermembrane receptor protein